MEGRWVCRRCFSSNEPDAGACAACGLERGADVPEAERTPVASATTAGGISRWLPVVGRFWWIGLVLVVVVGGWWFGAKRDDAGQIVGGGDLQVADLRIGDCFNLADATATEVEQVDARPCSDPHEFELFHDGTLPGDAYPGDAAFDSWVIAECIPAFEAYVGLAYVDSALDFSYFTPQPDGWASGDHTVQCVLYEPGNTSLTASLRGAGR